MIGSHWKFIWFHFYRITLTFVENVNVNGFVATSIIADAKMSVWTRKKQKESGKFCTDARTRFLQHSMFANPRFCIDLCHAVRWTGVRSHSSLALEYHNVCICVFVCGICAYLFIHSLLSNNWIDLLFLWRAHRFLKINGVMPLSTAIIMNECVFYCLFVFVFRFFQITIQQS